MQSLLVGAALGLRRFVQPIFGDKSQHAIECESSSLSRKYCCTENSWEPALWSLILSLGLRWSQNPPKTSILA